MEYDFEAQRVVSEIKKRGSKLVGLQFPEGLKVKGVELADVIERSTGAKTIISIDPCFGACDLRDDELARLGCDLLVHFAHSGMLPKTSIPVVYVEARTTVDISFLKQFNNKKYPFKKIGIITTVQHISQLTEIKKTLESQNFTVLVGTHGPRASYDGQILGCDFGSALSVADGVDAFLYFGSGRFHPLGVALRADKPVFIADPEFNEIRSLEEEVKKAKKISAFDKAQAKGAKTFALLVSTKKGQDFMGEAMELKKKLECEGKKAHIFAGDLLLPDYFLPFAKDIDVYVICGCPRIIDDREAYKKPLLNYWDVDV